MLSKVYKLKFLLAMMLVPFLVSAQPPDWDEPTNTLFTHNLVIPATVTPEINGIPLATGDYVGVFFNDGGALVCGGLVEYTAGVANAFSAFGDDPLTPAKEGFNMGETLIWRAYVDADDESYWADVTYAVGPAVFTTFGYSEIGSFVGPSFAVSASASPDLFCGDGGDVTLTGTQLAGDPIVSWDWYDNGDLVGSGQVLVVPNVEESTTFRLVATDDNGLFVEAYVNVTVIAASAGEDQHVCDDVDEIQLNGSATGFVGLNWATTGTGTFSNPGILDPMYFPSEDDKVSGVTLTMNVVTLDCGPFSDELELTFEASPYISIIPDEDYVCFGESYDFEGLVEAGDYADLQWFTTNGAGSFVPDETVLEPVYQPSTLDYLQGCIEIGVAASPNLPCTVSDEDFMILCFVAPPEAFAGDPVTLCDDVATTYTFADAEVTFDPVYGGEILWTTTGDGSFDDATLENPTYTFGPMDIEGGLIEFTLTATTPEACEPAVSNTSIFIQAGPTINILQDEYLICEGEDLDFTGEVETNGEYSALQWATTNGSGFFSPNENVLEPTYVVSTLDYLTYANGECIELIVIASPIDPCTVSADDMTLLCFQMLPVVVAGDDATVCSHEIFTTDPTVENSDGPYMWTVDPTDAGTFADPTALVTDFDPNPAYEGQTVQLMLTADPIAPCAEPQSGVMDLYIEYAPYVNAGPDMTICETESATIEGECEHVAFTMWATTGDGYFECPDFSCEQVEYFPGPGDIADGCVTLVLIGYPLDPCTLWVLDKMKLCFDPAPVVDAGDDQTVCQGDDVQLDATAEDYCGLQWVTFDGTGTFSDETILNPVYTPSFQDVITGTVHLTLIAAGCDACNYSVESTVAITIQWGPEVSVGQGGIVCEDGFVLDAATASYYASLLWTTVGDGTFDDATLLNPVYTPGAGDIAAEMVELCLTAEPIDPCTVAATACAIFEIQGLPTIDILPEEDEICFGDVYDFTGKVVAGNYSALQWFTTNGAGAFSPSETILEPTYQPSTLDYLQGCIEIGVVASPIDPCTVSAEDFMTLCFQAPPEVNAGDDATICEDGTYTTAPEIENGGTVLWTTSGDGSFDDPTMEIAIYTPGPNDIANGVVELCIEVQGLSTCDAATDCLTIVIQPLPVAFAGDDAIICEQLCTPPWTNGILELSGMVENACGSMWMTAGDGTFDDASALDAVYTLGDGDIAAGTVVLTLHALPCDPCTVHGLDELTITVQPFPMADAGPDQTICEGDDAQLDGFAENHSGVFWDYALLGEGDGTFSSQVILDPVYTPGTEDIALGYVELILVAFPIDPCTYPDADIMTLTITPAPVANTGGDATICEGETYYFADATAENADYVVWSTAGDGTFDDPALVNPTYTPGPNDIAAGIVEICLEAFDGSECDHIEFKDCMFLTINPPPTVYAGEDATICEDNEFGLNDATADNVSSVEWTTSGTGSFVPAATDLNPTYVPSADDILAGSVVLTLTGYPIDPCTLEAVDELTLTIQLLPTVEQMMDVTICETDVPFCIDATAANYSSLLWSTSGTGTFDNETIEDACYTPSADDVDNGMVSLCLTAEPIDPCTFAAEACFTLYIQKAPVVEPLDDATICEYDVPFVIDATAANYESLLWTTTGDGTFNDPSAEDIEYTPGADDVAAGSVELCLTAEPIDPCTVAATECMILTINLEPFLGFCFNGVLADEGFEEEYCFDEIVTVSLCEVWAGVGPFTVVYEVNGVEETAVVELGDNLFSDLLEPGDYVIQVISITDANGCMSQNVQPYVAYITINPEPVAAFCFNGELAETGSVFEFCYDVEVDVTLCAIVDGEGPFEVCYSINGEPEVCVIVAEGESLFTDLLEAGTYNIAITSITDANGCEADVTPYVATVIVNPEPALLFDFNGEIASTGSIFEFCFDEIVTVSLFEVIFGEEPFDLEWTVNGTPYSATGVMEGDELFSEMLEPGTYEVVLTSIIDANGCEVANPEDIYYATVIVNEEPVAAFCFNGELAETGSVFEYCYDEEVDVTLCSIVAGEGPFEVCYSINGEPEICITVAEGESLFTDLLAAGTYNIVITSITDANGCEVADVSPYMATVIINPEPFLVFAFNGVQVAQGFTETYCEDTPVVVTVDEIWSGIGPFEVCYSINGEPEVCVTVANVGDELFNDFLLPGVYTVEVTSLVDLGSDLNCAASDATLDLYTAVITIQAGPTAEILTDDDVVCEDGTLTLFGEVTNYSIFYWTGDGVADPNSLLTTYTPTADQIAAGEAEICLVAEPIDPCSVNAEDCITITINALPTVDAGDDVTVCNSIGSTVDITGTATSYSSVLWSYDIGTYGFIGDFVPADELITTFTVDVLSGFDVIEICLVAEPIDPCTTVVEDCINLYFQAPPVADAGDDALICEGDNYQLDGFVENESSFEWSTAGDGTFDNINILDPVYTPGAGDIANGGVILTLTAFDGACDNAVDDMFLEIVPVPTIEIEPEVMLDCNNYDFVDGIWLPIEVCAIVNNAESVQWTTDGDGFFDDPQAACTNYNLGDNDKWAQVITLTLEAIGPGNCGFVAVAEVLIHVPTQLILIDNPTWWGISSFVDKSDTSVPDVMYPAVGPGPGSEDLVIMINKGGQYYWPEPTTPINQLGNWSPIGYKAKFKNETCIPIYGDVLSDLTFEVGGPSLFTYVPVLTNVATNVNALFGADLDNVLLIYDWDTGVFWTEDTPFDLTEFLPGKAYLLVRKAGAPVFDITFPAFDPNAGPGAKISGAKSVFGSNAVWNDVVNTSNPHFIMFSEAVSSMMQPGDVIGAFNYLDECVGVATYGSKDQGMKLAVMGDDPITDFIDGFEAGENMTFKLYRPSTDETFEVSFTYDLEYPNYDNTYELYGASRVVDMTMTATSVGNVPADLSVSIFPNPARDVINIVSDYEIKSVSLVNYVGQTVYTRDVTGFDFQIDVSTYTTGLYFVQLETADGSVITERIAVE